MSTLKNIMKDYGLMGRMAYRAVVLLGMVALMWMNGHYVTRLEYEKFQEKNGAEHLAIQTTINQISTAIALLSEQKVVLSDHENRLRALERETVQRLH